MKLFLILFIVFLLGCGEKSTTPKRQVNEGKIISSVETQEIKKTQKVQLDSILQKVKINNIDTFSIRNLQTDDFSEMIPIDEELFKLIYPSRNDYTPKSFYIFSKILNEKEYYTLIIYQKNFEGEDYRVDYIELVNITKDGLQLDKIRLTVEDNETIIYEVNSILKENTLIQKESISTFSESDSTKDTLHHTEYTFKLFGEKRIDTLNLSKTFELIGE